MIPDQSLIDYTEQFFGFGNWCAPIWFVGMEEGGGNSKDEILARLKGWEGYGKKELECAPSFYPACGVDCWHGKGARIQSTWKQLIRMFLLAQGKNDSDKSILDYQVSLLGKAGGDLCLTELLPLPSPSIGKWLYSEWSHLPWLRTREAYQNYMFLARANAIRQRIVVYRPKIVIFYGSSWKHIWAMIAGVEWRQGFSDQYILLQGEREGTVYYLTRHPTREKDRNFSQIGQHIRRHTPLTS